MRFQGKIAAWFWGLVIFGSLMLLYTIWDIFQQGSWGELPAMILGFFLFHLLCIPILVCNYAEITEEKVIVHFGFFKESMELKEIREIYKTRNPISSTAASLDRIEIVGRRQSIICAVREREEFIQELKRRM